MSNNIEKDTENIKLPFFGIPKIIPYIKHYRKSMLFMLIACFGTSLVDLVLPLFQRYAIKNFVEVEKASGVWIFAVCYLFVILLQIFCFMYWARTAWTCEMRIGRDLKRASFDHLQTLSFSYFNTNAVGYVHARVMSDTSMIAQIFTWGLVDVSWTIIYLIGACIMMLWLKFELAVIVIAVVPIVALVSFLLNRRLVEANRKVREVNSVMTGKFNEGIVGAKTTKTLLIEDKTFGDFSSQTKEMKRAAIKSAHFSALFISVSTFLCSFAVAIVMWQGGKLTSETLMDVATLSAFITYALNMVDPITELARTVSDLVGVKVNIERFTKLMNTEPDVKDSEEVIEKYGDSFTPKKENWEEIEGDIELCDVSFKYPDGNEYVLEHFSLKIPAGTNVAIVGETGAGKSTLVNLVCRFFEPTSGKILIDGRDYKERSQLWLHSNIGYVLQTPHLFSGTVRDNLKYSYPEATDEELYAALEAVSAKDVVDRLDGGLDFNVGEGGDLLSVGEKQLISFARAILADPRIFVLDEATSSIDTLTESLIQSAIEKLLSGRTSFMIAHRLSTIRKADIILVVRSGKIVESGTHEELFAKKGYYYSLYTRQYQDETSAEILGGNSH